MNAKAVNRDRMKMKLAKKFVKSVLQVDMGLLEHQQLLKHGALPVLKDTTSQQLMLLPAAPLVAA